MALFNRFGNMLRASSINSGLNAQVPSMLNAIRSMSSMKLFVGGLSYGTDETSLKEAFANYGEVAEARVITDRDTGRSRGFGFVSFTSTEDATSALTAMDGQALHGRNIRVSYAQEKPPRAGFGGGGQGYGNNYRGGFGDSGANDGF